MYHKRLPYYLILSLAVLCIAPAALPQAKGAVGAVVQTWTYDPNNNPPLVTLKIVNTSHKVITAFNIAIKETYADGRVEQHEHLKELAGKILRAKELEGDTSSGAEDFRKLEGDGAWHPGEVRDEQLPVQPGLTDYQAVIDVVTYMDGTADSTNQAALERIIDERQATLASQKIATEIIQAALADPNDTDPSMTAAKKIQDRATIWRAQQHTKLDLDAWRLESIANEIRIVSSRNVNKRDALKQVLDKEEAKLSIISVHATPPKTGGPQ